MKAVSWVVTRAGRGGRGRKENMKENFSSKWDLARLVIRVDPVRCPDNGEHHNIVLCIFSCSRLERRVIRIPFRHRFSSKFSQFSCAYCVSPCLSCKRYWTLSKLIYPIGRPGWFYYSRYGNLPTNETKFAQNRLQRPRRDPNVVELKICARNTPWQLQCSKKMTYDKDIKCVRSASDVA